MAIKELIGKVINKVYISDDHVLLKFTCIDRESIIYVAEADCCNDVWFNHINGLQNLIGAVVISVHDKPTIEDATPTKQDEDIIYGWTVVTANGYFDVEMRNSSNGYYGGTLSLYPNELVTEDLVFKELESDF